MNANFARSSSEQRSVIAPPTTPRLASSNIMRQATNTGLIVNINSPVRRPIVAKLAPLAIALFAYAAFLVGLAATYARLPERMASHFDASGVADGWMTRDAYVWFMVGVVTFVSLTMNAAFGSVRFLPNAVINIPRRDYWLAPE